MARNALMNGFTVAQVISLTGLSEVTVQELLTN